MNMTHLKQLASPLIVIVIVLAIGAASAQSLGDYARNVRKNKTEPTTATRTFDNDNLPTGGTLSVVGPAAAGDGSPAGATAVPSPDKATSDRQKAADDWKAKLANQQQKVDGLNKEIEKEQADSRMRAAVAASDPASRLRNAGEWGKEDADYQNSLDQKQKALDAAREELDQMQENARKAGVREQDKDKGNQ
jgi:hypothetical protein